MTLRRISIHNVSAVTSLKRVRRTTVLLFASFLSLVILAVVLHLAEQYSEAVDSAKRTARGSARTVESLTERTLGETHRVLEGIGDFYTEQIRLNRFDEGDLHRLLAGKLKSLPYLSTLYVLDVDKKPIATGRVYPLTPAALEQFRAVPIAPSPDESELFIGELYQSDKYTLDGVRYYLPLSTRIMQDGRLVGYAVGILRPDYFATFFNTMDVGPLGAVELWRADGLVIAASKNSSLKTADSYPEFTKYFQRAREEAEGAQELVYAVSDGYSRRIQAVDRVGEMPLAVMVILDGNDYLKPWRDSRNRIGLVMIGIFIVMVGTGLFIFSQLKRSEQNETELRRAKASAEEANEAKSRFLAHMSHEFRTPLNAIMGFSEIIKNKVLGEGVSPVYVSYADHIHKSGEHLLNIVNDILDMAKIESGIQPLHREAVNVAGTIKSAIAFVDRLASERGLRIVVNVPASLPDISADERYLRQILINLLTNATKFSAPGLEIEVEARRHDKGLDISVADRGPGIDAALMRRIGEPFLQGNPTVSRSGQGAGLGLSICKQYMDLLGGELLIASEPNQGTTASVRFPPELLIDPSCTLSKAAE
ncbi:MAG: sensor histidine kinase [Rhodospirillaceae bacterium]|nr:sensor histidine kinase [Rhodospirillaceae bacterium]